MIITTDEYLCGFQHSLKADKWLETVGNGLSMLDSSHSTAAAEQSEGFPRATGKRLLRGKKRFTIISPA